MATVFLARYWSIARIRKIIGMKHLSLFHYIFLQKHFMHKGSKHIEMLGKIKDRDDFVNIMRIYLPTVREAAIRNYLESLTAWVEAFSS